MKLKHAVKALLLPLLLAVAACDVPSPVVTGPGQSTTAQVNTDITAAAARLVRVADRIEPVAESVCLRNARDLNCDFEIAVDDSRDAPINAFQTRDSRGRPLIIVTVPMITYVRNDDEMAFVLAHEAAHHIARHLDRRQEATKTSALIFATAAAQTGASGSALETAARLGAAFGSRAYAKDYELEADAIGARIARDAGFDAINGARYFERAPDPGNRFLGTHPPNANRVEAVRAALR